MKYVSPSHLALAMLAGTLTAGAANACCGGGSMAAPSSPPSVRPPTTHTPTTPSVSVAPPSVSVPDVRNNITKRPASDILSAAAARAAKQAVDKGIKDRVNRQAKTTLEIVTDPLLDTSQDIIIQAKENKILNDLKKRDRDAYYKALMDKAFRDYIKAHPQPKTFQSDFKITLPSGTASVRG